MRVTVTACGGPLSIHAGAIRADAGRLLNALGERDAELTVVLVDDAAIHALNRDYRGRDRPTDVLAFAMREGVRVPGDESLLGDVVISLDTAARQARRRRRPLADELRTLLIHGILHVLGYDHERSAHDAERMQARERQLRAFLEAADPGTPGTRRKRGVRRRGG
jgi:probable rRNA maturation factor